MLYCYHKTAGAVAPGRNRKRQRRKEYGVKAFTENPADGVAIWLRAGEGEAPENGSGAAWPRQDFVMFRLRRMRPLARYAVGYGVP